MADRKRRLRWGVLGCARIARLSVIPAIQRSSNSQLWAIASRDPAKLKESQRQFNCPRAYPSYKELLADPDVEAVYIPVPNSLHCEWTVKAAEQGKPILCEKPIALNAAECQKMIAACEANGVSLMEAFMYRYTERIQLVREALKSGVLGEVLSISSTFRFQLQNPNSIKLQPKLGGGALYDVGCYGVNFIGLVIDETSTEAPPNWTHPDSVSAECTRKGGVDVSFSGLLHYPSGLIASVHCGFNTEKRIYSEIIGTEGVLEVPDTFLDNPGALVLTVGEERREIRVPESDRYRAEIEDFADALIQGRPMRLGLKETERNMQVMDLLLAHSR